jgi:HEAT repeat protein
VEVELTVAGGAVKRVKALHAGEAGQTPDLDLGVVDAAEAVAFLLATARRGEGRGAADGAVFSVVLADVPDAWRGLLALAQDREVDKEARKSALFWVGQEAAASATRALADVASAEDEDQDVRDAAVFALSQREADESVPMLMEIAATARQARTRRSAFFWLAQIDDARVPAFFRDVLLRAPGG